jgi:dTDP-4-dehydrorhamnose 3,5-epimerase-like enzyme
MITAPTRHPSPVKGVQLCEMRHVIDPLRGNLTVGEFGSDLPFVPRRFFLTYAIPDLATRGQHAHRHCLQFLICIHGECHLQVDDGRNRQDFRLNRPNLGVFIPALVWTTTLLHSPDSVLMVLASHPYDPADYIRDYTQFLTTVAQEVIP